MYIDIFILDPHRKNLLPAMCAKFSRSWRKLSSPPSITVILVLKLKLKNCGIYEVVNKSLWGNKTYVGLPRYLFWYHYSQKAYGPRRNIIIIIYVFEIVFIKLRIFYSSDLLVSSMKFGNWLDSFMKYRWNADSVS